MSRILQAANFVAPRSGGLRTTLAHLAEGYAAAGHEVVQVVPGPGDAVQETSWGRRVVVRSPEVRGTGYRLMLRRAAVERLVERERPDRLEVHDRTTLRGLGRWAARRDVPATVVSHERLDQLLGRWLPAALPLQQAADRSNRELAASFDTVVCTTGWAAEEFRRLGTPNLLQVPLGVDLAQFRPDAARAGVRSALARDDEALLLLVSRLSREKRPELAVDTVAELARRGSCVRLLVAGDGPLRRPLLERARGLPTGFLGFVTGPEWVAQLLATADLVLAPGPVETFGLAALEALACGTPVVADAGSALPEVLGPDAGRAVDGTPQAFADAVESLLEQPRTHRCATARGRAEQFPWSTTVAGMLAAHRLPVSVPTAVGVSRRPAARP